MLSENQLSDKATLKEFRKEQRLKEKAELLLRRTEGDILFIYRGNLSRKFIEWSAEKRDLGITPTFLDFYNDLPANIREHIAVSMINQANGK